MALYWVQSGCLTVAHSQRPSARLEGQWKGVYGRGHFRTAVDRSIVLFCLWMFPHHHVWWRCLWFSWLSFSSVLSSCKAGVKTEVRLYNLLLNFEMTGIHVWMSGMKTSLNQLQAFSERLFFMFAQFFNCLSRTYWLVIVFLTLPFFPPATNMLLLQFVWATIWTNKKGTVNFLRK